MEDSLLEWYCKLGIAEAKRQTKIAQMYGTLMHLEIGKFLIEKVYDFDTTQSVTEQYLSDHNYWEPECKEWALKLKYDMASFIQFSIDYDLEPLGIEYVLLSEKGFGTLIDLVCNLTVEEQGHWGEVYKTGDKKGEAKLTKKAIRKRAIINFKSGRKGFYRSNGIQIECERQLWEENFPDLPLDMALNWAPNEWRDTPGYHIKDWVGDICQDEVDAVLALARVRYANKAERKEYLHITGVVSSGESLAVALQRENIEDFCSRKFSSTPITKPAQKATTNPIVKKEFKSQPLPI